MNAIRLLSRPRHLFLMAAALLFGWIAAICLAVKAEDPDGWLVAAAVFLAGALIVVQISAFAPLGSLNRLQRTTSSTARSIAAVKRTLDLEPGGARGKRRDAIDPAEVAVVDAVELLAKAVVSQSQRFDAARDEHAASMRQFEDRLVRSWEAWAAAEFDLEGGLPAGRRSVGEPGERLDG